jgi:hypothetical protein
MSKEGAAFGGNFIFPALALRAFSLRGLLF